MTRGFDGIQGLRALAAMSVVCLHIADEAGTLAGTPEHAPWRWVDALPLEAGVDLFFVISGFVLVWASWDRFGNVWSVLPFIGRRLLRVAPLYWLLTGATVAAAALLPGAISEGLRDGWAYVVASALFWPWRRQDGFVQPILRPGWTLEYEVLFYALLAVALPLPRRWGLTALLGAITALAIAGHTVAFAAVPLAFWTDPIVLEFAFGVLVAMVARQGHRAGWSGLLAFATACAVAVTVSRVAGDELRVVIRGIPAALLVFCALSWTRVPRWATALGDASYALYLVHPFPMRAVHVLSTRLPTLEMPAIYAFVTVPLCVLMAILLHRTIEQPILRLTRRIFDGAATNRADARLSGE